MTRPTGFRELQQQLNDLAARGGDPSPLLPGIADAFHDAQSEQYARGRGWKPLSAAYAAQKAREGRPAQVGVYSGGLRASLVSGADRHSVERVTRDKTSIIVGSSNPVANLFGGKHKTRKQPRRKPVRLTPVMRRQWLEWAQDYFVKGRVP